jgi:tetratricopeptide (TPR) repeat protein
MTMHWLAELQRAPEKAVSQALAGFVDFGSYQRADADDAIVTILQDLDDAESYRGFLARGIWDWLNERRGFSALQREVYGLDPFIREIREALLIAQRLGLTSITKSLLADFWQWENWSRKLQLGHPSRDVRLELLKLCAIHQQPLQTSDLEPKWIQLCRDAGTTAALSYLDVALLGLRSLPREPTEDLAPRVAFGFGLWAATYNPSKDDFVSRWNGIRNLMLHVDPAWGEIVEAAIEHVCRYLSLADPVSRAAGQGTMPGFREASWWRETIKGRARPMPVGARRQKRLSGTKSGQYFAPNAAEERDLVTLARREGFTRGVRERVLDLLDKHELWVRFYGDSYNLQRALATIIPTFINLSSRHATEILLPYLRRALMWDDRHDGLWNLWQRSLFRLDQYTFAENVGWEAVRRFPEDVETRVQLAQLLMNFNRWREAESLLQEVSHLAVGKAPYYLVLGKIVAADRSRLQEALDLITVAIDEMSPRITSTAQQRAPSTKERQDYHNLLVFAAMLHLNFERNDIVANLLNEAGEVGGSPHYFAVRFRLAFREEGIDEARKWLDEGLGKYPRDRQLLQKRKYIEETSDPVLQHDDALSDIGIAAAQEQEWLPQPEKKDDDPASAEIGEAAGDVTPNATIADPDIGEPESSPGKRDFRQLAAAEHAAKVSAPPAAKPAAARPPEAQGSKPRKAAPQPDYTLNEAVRHGQARWVDFALNGANLSGPARRHALSMLDKLVKDDPEFLYGQIVRGRRTPTDTDLKGIPIPHAVEIEFAARERNTAYLQRSARRGIERLLADLGSALAGEQEACERWKKGIPRFSSHQGHASRVLQRLLTDLATSELELEDKTQFRSIWKVPMNDVSELAAFFYQAVDATLLFSISDNSVMSDATTNKQL